MTDFVSTSYRLYRLVVSKHGVSVRTPDGRRLGAVASMSGARRLVRAHRREVRS